MYSHTLDSLDHIDGMKLTSPQKLPSLLLPA